MLTSIHEVIIWNTLKSIQHNFFILAITHQIWGKGLKLCDMLNLSKCSKFKYHCSAEDKPCRQNKVSLFTVASKGCCSFKLFIAIPVFKNISRTSLKKKNLKNKWFYENEANGKLTKLFLPYVSSSCPVKSNESMKFLKRCLSLPLL